MSRDTNHHKPVPGFCGFCDKKLEVGQVVMREQLNISGASGPWVFELHQNQCYEFWEHLILTLINNDSKYQHEQRGTRHVTSYTVQ